MTGTPHQLGLGRDAGLYYTNDAEREAKPRNRDEYYSRDGGGTWWSTGETIVRNGAAIDKASFRDLCAGIDPRTGAPLVRGAGEKHRAGLDLTMSPGKTVSLLWMAGTAEQRAKIEAAQRAAVDRTLRFVLDEGLVVVRMGAGGIHKSRPSDLIAGLYEHYTTREGDPSIHTHCVLINVAGNPTSSRRYKSKHLTIETKPIFDAQLLIGSAFRSALAAELKASFGFTYRAAGRGQWEIAGVPQEIIEVFSKRSQQIEKRVGDRASASAAQKQIAALGTRNSKDRVPTGQELEDRWTRELTQTGIDPWQAALEFVPEMDRDQEHDFEAERPIDPPEIAGETPVAIAASALFRHQSVIDRESLLRESLIEASLRGLGPEAVYQELAQLEASGSLLRLGDQLWTSPGIAATEAAMLRAAARPQERAWFDNDKVAAVLQTASHLSDEQRAAVLHACWSDGVSIIEAGAGTGKTTLARALVKSAQQSGLTAIGLAPSWIAADELAKSTGIEAQAIARWRWYIGENVGTGLTAQHVIIVDEAGMVGTRDLAAVLTTAQEAGAKVVLMGDRRQLQSVPGASALRAVSEIVEQGAVIDQVRRQQVDWQRAASILMTRGNSEAGLRAYASHDRLELVDGDGAARQKVIALWQEQRLGFGEDVLIITRRNTDAVALNLAARQVLRHEGKIASDEVLLPAIGRDKKRGDLPLSAGDQIRFGETLPQFGIRNGTRAQIRNIVQKQDGGTRLEFALEDGQQIVASWNDLARPSVGKKRNIPRISHAYAGTSYSAQGRTASAAVLYISGKTDAREIYVGLTRHQQDARIVVESSRLDAACRQRQADRRIQPTQVAMKERLFKEAGQYREKDNVVDFVANRGIFIEIGVVTLPDPEQSWGIGSAIRAAQALHNALRGLDGDKLLVPAVRMLQYGRRLLQDLPQPLQAMVQMLRETSRREIKPRDPARTFER